MTEKEIKDRLAREAQRLLQRQQEAPDVATAFVLGLGAVFVAAHVIRKGNARGLLDMFSTVAGAAYGLPLADQAAPLPPPVPKIVDHRARAARKTLGFKWNEKLDEAKLKERRRELAKRFHPDAGGTLEQMTAVNAATDYLLSKL